MNKSLKKSFLSSSRGFRALLSARAKLLCIYLILVSAVTAILFWRYPNNVIHANFYGEDGSVYLQNILNKGWLSATFTPFNGYFIIGLYALCGFGWLINIVFGAGLLTLPNHFALAAIIFMAAVVALPYPLFGSLFGRKKVLLTVLFGALLPLSTAPHIVLGTIGNQKWIFLYLALLMVLYRLFNYKKLSVSKLLAIDGVLLLCAYTNSVTYALIPLLFLPYAKDALSAKRKSSLLRQVLAKSSTKEVRSLIILCMLLLPQMIYIGLHGIPALPGYLDSPYELSKTVEIFVNRTFIYGVSYGFNGHLNNVLVVAGFASLLLVSWRKLKGKEKVAFFVSLYAAGMASLLFTINRPGVSDFFFNYRFNGSGPDQFFYTQTLIMYLPIVLVAFAVCNIVQKKWLRLGLLSVFVLFVIGMGLRSDMLYVSQWRSASVFENYSNTFIDQSIISCAAQHPANVRIVVYPYPDGRFTLTAPRTQVCATELRLYQKSYEDLGLRPSNNNFKVVGRGGEFYQTFAAKSNGLDGVRILISNFGNLDRRGTYSLTLYDHSCRKSIRTVRIPRILMDSSYYNARFKPVANSEGREFCFSLSPPTGHAFDVIAIQRSQEDAYREGDLIENGKRAETDIVFQPLYSQVRP